MTTDKPRVLIEDWLPVAELGIESRRERKVFTDLPPLNYLHVWWARRPIVASQGVVLAGLLPAWTSDLASAFPDSSLVANPSSYRAWLLHLIGIWGDPIKGARNESEGVLKGKQAFGYPQAWKNSPSSAEMTLLHRVLEWTWGELPAVADPTAGGGSIPFAAARFGLPTFANDLNSVAAAVMIGGLESPAAFGSSVSSSAAGYAEELAQRLDELTAPYFPRAATEEIVAYLYAYEIACPRTGRRIPLMPNLWLDRDAPRTAVRIDVNEDNYQFEVQSGAAIDFDPGTGTIKGGNAISPYDDLIIEGDYIKDEAQAERMRPVLYAVAWRRKGSGRGRAGRLAFRAPSEADLKALEAAADTLQRNQLEWMTEGMLPDEDIPEASNYDRGHRLYGIYNWRSMFTPRQLLTHVTFVQEYRNIIERVRQENAEQADAILNLLTLMHGKMLDYNSRMSAWNVNQQSVRNTFESHNFAFKSTFVEKMTPGNLLRWASSQVCKAERISSDLISSTRHDLPVGEVVTTQGNAANWSTCMTGSVTHVCIDPPYYDNVMYAELSDYFHVWHRRTYGTVRPDLFPAELADIDNEAIANPARFSAMGRRRKELADADYEAKMTAIFIECRRVLRDDGVLTVMFTHKRAEAWDTLGMGLIQAGFVIEASWPVNTEFEFSTHQANLNSASSTIMLVCRKREAMSIGGRVFLDDIEAEIRSAARDAAMRFQHDGIDGVDLLLSTYGPTLAVISKQWPVYSSAPDAEGRDQLLRPEDALHLAREEVVQLRRARLVGKAARVDAVTDFVLLAWDIFGAREFPFDTARLLALAVGGLDVDDLARAKVLSKKAGTVALLAPSDRLRRDVDSDLPGVRPEATKFESMIDAVDTALYIADVDGMPAAKRFVDRHGFASDSGFIATVQGLANAIPRAKAGGQWAIPEAGVLDTLCTLYFPTVSLPAVDEPGALPEQHSMFGES